MSQHKDAQHQPDHADHPQEGTSVQAPPKPKPAKPQRRALPRFKLILHNDDVNAMDDVVRAVVTLTPLSTEQAVRHMLEAHFTGTAVLLLTHKERGELYVQQFASMHITTSLEPDQ